VYYLYGIERLAALANLTEIAGHDWYEEGAAALVAYQRESGMWEDGCGQLPATSLGLLFLIRATEQMLDRPQSRPRGISGGLQVGGRGLPQNLDDVQVDRGTIRTRKLKGPVDSLLAELENAKSDRVESAEAALVETITAQEARALVGQTDRLLKLLRDPRPTVRRAAAWALGRTNELRVVPQLIQALSDADPGVMLAANDALRFISKRVTDVDLPDEPTEAQRNAAIARWKKWYLAVRPYSERDDLEEPIRP
jgi:hypothetical protein